MYWLCFRRGTAHNANNSLEVVLRSNDLRRWHEVKAFESPYGIEGGCAAADGYFCVTPDRLYIIIGTRNPIHAFASWTSDGVRWSTPELLKIGDVCPYAWQVHWHQGRFYVAVNYLGTEQEPRLDLIVSEDAVNWKHHSEIASGQPPGFHDRPDGFTEESELHWRADDELWCVIRTNVAVLYCARPPYTQWEEALVLYAGCDAPAMCETGGEVCLAGCCAASWQVASETDDTTRPFAVQNTFNYPNNPLMRWETTGLYRLRRNRADLLVMLPPGADTSYPGLVLVEQDKLIMSYYSDVAYISGQIRPMHFPEYACKQTESDIYIAEIDVGTHGV